MTDVTEIVKLDPSRVDLVTNPANGFPFLLMKAVNGEAPEGSDNASKDESVDKETPQTETPKTDSQGDAQNVSKAELETIVKSAVAEASKASEERIKTLETELAKVKATPIPGGPAMTVPATMRDQAVKAEKLAEAAHFTRLAEQVGDADLKKYYKDRAAVAKSAAGA